MQSLVYNQHQQDHHSLKTIVYIFAHRRPPSAVQTALGASCDDTSGVIAPKLVVLKNAECASVYVRHGRARIVGMCIAASGWRCPLPRSTGMMVGGDPLGVLAY